MSPHRVVLAALIGAALIIAIALLVWPAGAHQSPTGFKFSSWCCNGNSEHGDCQQIPASAVEELPDGYRITLKPGDHHMVTKEHVFFKKPDEVKFTDDGNFYACLYPDEDTLRCFYAPPLGS